MAGDPITVSTSVTLPAQPVLGTVAYIPLGGDGFIAPFASYVVQGFRATGDASSGRVELNIQMDDRFCSLVQFVSLEIAQATEASADFRMFIGSTAPVSAIPRQNESGVIQSVDPLVTNGREISRTWSPVPYILPGGRLAPSIVIQALNVDTDNYFVDASIYLFDITVREKTPMGPLLWSRGST